jgi:hypothetical protein
VARPVPVLGSQDEIPVASESVRRKRAQAGAEAEIELPAGNRVPLAAGRSVKHHELTLPSLGDHRGGAFDSGRVGAFGSLQGGGADTEPRKTAGEQQPDPGT